MTPATTAPAVPPTTRSDAHSTPTIRRRRLLTAAVAALAATIALTACGSAGSSSDSRVNIVGFSVPKSAYDALSVAFSEAHEGVEFSQSYGASGSQSKAVASGQPADYVAFSLEPDMTRLVPDIVSADWDSGATKGMVSDSVVVFVVRPGNPLNLTTWDDLIKPGVTIVTPDPASSGSAKWNILAAYTQVTAQGGTDADAADYMAAFFGNVVSKPASGAEATTTFTNGTGDVLLSYENEAIAARQQGLDVDYVVPAQSFLIENPAAVTVTASQTAKDFLDFALSDEGQKIFASKGFRPVNPQLSPGTVEGANDPAHPFPTVESLTTIADLGGWAEVDSTFFDKDKGIITAIAGAAG